MKLSVDAQTVSAFVRGDPAVPLLSGCMLWQYQRQLARFEAFNSRLTESSASAGVTSQFRDCVAFMAARSAEVQRRVLSHPSFAIWLNVAEDLQAREADLKFPEFHLAGHLRDFGRFAAAAALLDEQDRIELDLRRGESGNLAFSGAGVWLPGATRDAYRPVAVSVEGGLLKANVAIGFAVSPLSFGGIEIEGFDWTLRVTGAPAFKFSSLDDLSVVKWQSSLDACTSMLAAAWPEMLAEITTGIRCVIPVEPSGPDIHASATFQEAPGLTALSWTADVEILAEALVHEHHHQKLNALLATVQLLKPHDRSQRYYSPWRNDPRPLLGLLHGAYSFHSVVKFWARVFGAQIPLLQRRRAVQRAHMTYLQVREALAALNASGAFTPLGKAFVDAMADEMDSVESQLPVITPGALVRVNEALAAHRDRHARNDQPVTPGGTLVGSADPTRDEAALIDRLGITWPIALRAIRARDSSEDATIQHASNVLHANLLEEFSPESVLSSALLTLFEAHQAYAQGAFEEALVAYRRFGDLSPNAKAYAAACSAFCLRHMRQWTETECVLGPAPALPVDPQ